MMESSNVFSTCPVAFQNTYRLSHSDFLKTYRSSTSRVAKRTYGGLVGGQVRADALPVLCAPRHGARAPAQPRHGAAAIREHARRLAKKQTDRAELRALSRRSPAQDIHRALGIWVDFLFFHETNRRSALCCLRARRRPRASSCWSTAAPTDRSDLVFARVGVYGCWA